MVRLTRRQLLASLGVASVGVLAASSVGSAAASEFVPNAAPLWMAGLQDTSLPDVPRNKTFIAMQSSTNNGQNPVYNNFNIRTSGGAVDGWHSGPLQTMAEPLIMFDVLTGDYENWLAESWQYNTDFTEIDLKLRDGITWSNGQPFTSKDVAYTFNIVRDNQDKMVHTAEINFLQEAQAVDNLNVKFILNKPNPRWWATTLTSNHGIVEQFYPDQAFNGLDPTSDLFYDQSKGWPVGTGPYKLVQTTPQQKVFDLDPNYWGAKTGFKPMPQIQRVIYLPNEEDTLAVQKLITGDIDMGKIVPVPTLKSAFAQNPKIVTFSGQDPPYGYTDWCPISFGFNNSAAPYDNPNMRWAINYAIDRTQLVNLAESGAGVLAYHQFTPYAWFQPFDQSFQPLEQKYGLDGDAHPDKVSELMSGMGYAKNGDGLWADSSGQALTIKVAVPDWLKNYGPPLSQQLRDAGFDASFDTSPGLDSLVQTGEQATYFNCQGPAGVKGMDPYFMLSIFTSQYYRPTGQPAPISWATSRYRNPAYDTVVDQISPLAVDDPQTLTLTDQAMDLWFKDLPMIYVSQLIIRYPMLTQYWTGWPSKDNPYGFPHSWQQELMKTIFTLQPAAG